MTKEMYSPSGNNDPRTAVQRMASANASDIERAMKEQHSRNVSVDVCDMMEAMGSKQYDAKGGVTLRFKYHNGTAFTKRLFFGTPLGDSAEAVLVPQIWATIADDNKWTNGLALQSDNQGANLTFFQLINKRFLRNQSVISSFEIVTSSDAQREISPLKVFVPWNNANSKTENLDFLPIYKEVTGQQLLNEGVVCGEFSGIALDVLAGVTISCNIYIAHTDCPTFKM